jgi:hypothetical protein
MEEAIILYRDAYGICRITGLSRTELAEQGVYVGNDIEFGFTSSWDLESEYQSDPAGVETARLLKDNPAYLMYLALKGSGRAINHTTFEKCHFYSVLAACDAAG